MPPAPGAVRATVIEQIVAVATARGPQRLRVAVDGLTAAGKTTLGHEVGRGLAKVGAPLRARRSTTSSGRGARHPSTTAHRARATTATHSISTRFGDCSWNRPHPTPPAWSRCAASTRSPRSIIPWSRSSPPTDGVLVVDGVFTCRPALDPRGTFGSGSISTPSSRFVAGPARHGEGRRRRRGRPPSPRSLPRVRVALRPRSRSAIVRRSDRRQHRVRPAPPFAPPPNWCVKPPRR